MDYKHINGGVCAPSGFKASGVHCGIRKNHSKKDLALILADLPCAAAAVYTQNKVCGAPIIVTRENLSSGYSSAVIINSGNANTCNANGIDIARAMCALVESETGAAADAVIVASTGVIGEPLNIEPIRSSMAALVAGLSYDGQAAAEAIMTTDTIVKQIAVEFPLGGKTCRIGAMAKGSGMIMPNMATLLGFITTDADITPDALESLLREAVEDSFNMVSIDGDTSTNDMVSIMASGFAGNPPITMDGSKERFVFSTALKYVCVELARMIAKDGEGATKLITCHVANAPDKRAARAVAKSVINSSLIKAAMFAADANWGRILCAIGYAPAEFDIGKINVSLSSKAGTTTVCDHGIGTGFDETLAKQLLSEDEVTIEIDMAQGAGEATAWGCDLTYDYVKINGSYRT